MLEYVYILGLDGYKFLLLGNKLLPLQDRILIAYMDVYFFLCYVTWLVFWSVVMVSISRSWNWEFPFLVWVLFLLS